MAAATVLRLQTIVSREVAANEASVARTRRISPAFSRRPRAGNQADDGQRRLRVVRSRIGSHPSSGSSAGTDPDMHAKAKKDGKVGDVPINHTRVSLRFSIQLGNGRRGARGCRTGVAIVITRCSSMEIS